MLTPETLDALSLRQAPAAAVVSKIETSASFPLPPSAACSSRASVPAVGMPDTSTNDEARCCLSGSTGQEDKNLDSLRNGSSRDGLHGTPSSGVCINFLVKFEKDAFDDDDEDAHDMSSLGSSKNIQRQPNSVATGPQPTSLSFPDWLAHAEGSHEQAKDAGSGVLLMQRRHICKKTQRKAPLMAGDAPRYDDNDDDDGVADEFATHETTLSGFSMKTANDGVALPVFSVKRLPS